GVSILCLDKGLGGAVGGTHKVDVFRRAARGVDSEHGEGMFENLRQSVDGVFFEEDQLTWAQFARGIVSDGDLCGSGENVEVLVAAGVEVRRNRAVDAKYAAACGFFIGEADVGEHSLGGFGECGGESDDVEEFAVGGHMFRFAQNDDRQLGLLPRITQVYEMTM